MANIDLTKLCQEYVVSEDQTDSNQARSISFNLNHLTLEVVPGSETWTHTQPITDRKPQTRQVTVTRKQDSLEVYGNVQTSKESKMVQRVVLTNAIKGFNGRMKIPLPKEVREEVGDNIDIYPGQNLSETPSDKMTVSVNSGQEFQKGATAAVATIHCDEKEYEGCFSCQVQLEGNIIYDDIEGSTTQCDIVELIRGLKEKNLPELRNVNVVGKTVQFKMEGKVDLRWSFNQTLSWQ